MSTYTNPRLRGELTTDHAASTHGIPVLVIDGDAYGPLDYLPAEYLSDPEGPVAAFFGNAPQVRTLAAMHVLAAVDRERVQHDEFDGKVHPNPMVEAFIEAWVRNGAGVEFELDVEG